MALRQTGFVVDALRALSPGLKIDTKIITTKGDVDQAPIPLDEIGKTWFTAEIEQALQSGEIDVAVHSLKDLPPELPAGLSAAPVLERADPRDVLVATKASSLAGLPQGAVVGTDSLRRKALLLQHRPDLIVKSVRGNVGTRLKKLHAGQYDALVLAAAGLERLGMLDVITEYFDPTYFVPAIGQGVLAAEARSDNAALWRILRGIQHEPTQAVVAAEQAFSQVVGGGCKLPVGCYVQLEAKLARIHGMVGSNDAAKVSVASCQGPAAQAVALASDLARQLLAEPFMAER